MEKELFVSLASFAMKYFHLIIYLLIEINCNCDKLFVFIHRKQFNTSILDAFNDVTVKFQWWSTGQ